MTEMATKNYAAVSVHGCVIFLDVLNPTVRHAIQMRPNIVMNLVHAWQSCYPMRIQSINVINAPEYVDVVLKIFRSFMSEKMKNRLHVYTQRTVQNCFKDIPVDILPVEYGGTDGTFKELTGNYGKLERLNMMRWTIKNLSYYKGYSRFWVSKNSFFWYFFII